MTTTRTAAEPATPFAADSFLTLQEVAEVLGKHFDTIRDMNRARRWMHARQDTAGRRTWRVPVSDLVAAGDLPAAMVARVEDGLTARRESKQVLELRERIVRLEEQLAAATALAADRDDQIKFLRTQVTHLGRQR